MRRRISIDDAEALDSDSGTHAQRVRKAHRLMNDIEALGGKEQAPDRLIDTATRLVPHTSEGDYEAAKYALGRRDDGPISQCTCHRCTDD